MTAIELIDELVSVRNWNMSAMGLAADLCLPIYSAIPESNFLTLGMLYKSPWPNAAQKTKSLSKLMESYLKYTELLPDGGNSKIYLSLDYYNFDYSMTIRYYETVGVDYKDSFFTVVAGAEIAGLRREFPVDPYLLKMQKEEPKDAFYFPYRPDIDG